MIWTCCSVSGPGWPHCTSGRCPHPSWTGPQRIAFPTSAPLRSYVPRFWPERDMADSEQTVFEATRLSAGFRATATDVPSQEGHLQPQRELDRQRPETDDSFQARKLSRLMINLSCRGTWTLDSRLLPTRRATKTL
jgi:hypothetical protein